MLLEKFKLFWEITDLQTEPDNRIGTWGYKKARKDNDLG